MLNIRMWNRQDYLYDLEVNIGISTVLYSKKIPLLICTLFPGKLTKLHVRWKSGLCVSELSFFKMITLIVTYIIKTVYIPSLFLFCLFICETNTVIHIVIVCLAASIYVVLFCLFYELSTVNLWNTFVNTVKHIFVECLTTSIK